MTLCHKWAQGPINIKIKQSKPRQNGVSTHKISFPNFDFERMSYISETDLEKDIDKLDLPLEMQRLLVREDKQILPHQEITELLIWE